MSEVICIGFDEASNNRIQSAVQLLEITCEFVKSSEVLFDRAEDLQPRFLIFDTKNFKDLNEIAGEVQVLRQFFPESFILIVASKRIPVEDASFIKKSGCNYVILENEFMHTIRLEYIMLQTVKAAYIPVRVSDFRPNTSLDFFVFTMMPLNKKMIPVIQPGVNLTAERLTKLDTVGELYVKRYQIELYSDYLKRNEDKTARGLSNRCRAQFHSVSHAHASLVFMITDQAEAGSYEEGRKILKKCLELCNDLLTTLAVVPEPWKVLDQSILGMLGATDRSMMIASMAALISFSCEIGVPEDVMMAGLFSDVGLLDLSPKAIGKIDNPEGRSQLSSEDLEIYFKHPVLSLNRLLERKMPVSEKIKEVILCTHERADKEGFPRRVAPHKIPLESNLILFHELVDLEFRVKFGKARESYPEVRKRIWTKEEKELRIFPLLFLKQMEPALKA